MATKSSPRHVATWMGSSGQSAVLEVRLLAEPRGVDQAAVIGEDPLVIGAADGGTAASPLLQQLRAAMAADVAKGPQLAVAAPDGEDLDASDIGRDIFPALRHLRDRPEHLPGPRKDGIAFLGKYRRVNIESRIEIEHDTPFEQHQDAGSSFERQVRGPLHGHATSFTHRRNFMIGSLRTFVISATAATFLAASVLPSMACTRVVFLGDDGTVITGRSMDWKEDMFSNMWMFPRGIARTGKSGPDSIAWTSKYGSVAVAGYELGTADGLNEKGLAGNLLYLAESDYGLGTRPGKPYLSISLWMQYALDNFATVAEAVEALEKEPFQILAPKLPNGAESTLHLSLSDATGNSAIFAVCGRQAGDPSRAPVPGDDQLSHLRPADRDQHLLGGKSAASPSCRAPTARRTASCARPS